MCYDKFSKSYRFEMPSNYANSLCHVNVHYERIAQACIDFMIMNIDIMQFRQHCARADKQNANFDHYFGINLRFLLK